MSLTPRETEVITLLAQGLSNKEIGRALGTELSTVRAQTTSIYKKLGVKNRTQAAMKLAKGAA